MSTKTEYPQYIGTEHWQRRRKQYIASNPWCELCDLPRWFAIMAYDQDLNVHHRSYAHLGAERDEELGALCRRCHEIETFGHTSLHQVKKFKCAECKEEYYFDFYSDPVCEDCRDIRRYRKLTGDSFQDGYDSGFDACLVAVKYVLNNGATYAVAPSSEIGVANFTPAIHKP